MSKISINIKWKKFICIETVLSTCDENDVAIEAEIKSSCDVKLGQPKVLKSYNNTAESETDLEYQTKFGIIYSYTAENVYNLAQ